MAVATPPPSIPPPTPNLTKIANEAGVSRSTVSRVLQPGPHASPVASGTQERVIAVARRLGWTAALETRREVGLMLLTRPHTEFGVYTHLSSYLVLALGRHGFDLRLVPLSDGLAGWRAAGLDRRLSAVIMSAEMAFEPDLAGRLGIPTCLLNMQLEPQLVDQVIPDDAGGMALGAAHLLALGHRHLAWFEPAANPLVPMVHQSQRDRIATLRRACRDAGARLDTCIGPEALARCFAEPERPTALVCYCEWLLPQAYAILAAQGLRVPNDCSVVGIGHPELTAFTTPPTTTVAVPMQEMAIAAVDLVIGRIGATPAAPRTVIVPEPLIVRESTAMAVRRA